MIQSLQKSHFRYAKCQGGDLHSGQTLNLVCVDQRCDHRGLICPVCKMQSHNECHVLPVKIFLGQIRDLFSNTHNPDQLNNLGAYLRTLNSTKKQMLTLLKNQINQLADIYKDIQIKIESTYIALRQNILIQSTLTTKLPTLLQDLLKVNCTDPFNLQKQFSKYCQLIKYRDGKPKVTDKALSLVEHYKNLPEKVKTLMTSSIKQYRSKLQQISQKIQKQQNAAEVVKEIQKSSRPVFSTTLKSYNALFNADKDEFWLKNEYDEGFACMEQHFTSQNNSVNIDITQLGQNNYLMLAVGKKQLIDSWGTEQSAVSDNKHLLAAYVCSNGSDSRLLDEDEDYSSFFFGKNQKVTVTLHPQKSTVTFKNSQLNNLLQLPTIEPMDSIENYQLVVVLSQADKVRLSQ